jgi:hypothetical protein
VLLIAEALFALAAGPVLASPCTDQINALDVRLNDTAETAGAVSSGGKAVAAAREGQAVQPESQSTPVGTPGAPRDAQEAEATRKAAQAGGGGDRIMQAKATLNRARALDQQGNSAACLEAVSEAKRQLDVMP